MDTIAIFGVGLIGGSFALAVRRAGFSGSILGVSSPGTIREALDLGVIDEGVQPDEACRRADLVYLAQPILRIIELLPVIQQYVRPGALVTDAGSTKVRIVEAARVLPAGAFLGGHPMAGKELRGVTAAEAGLFEGRPYVLTPSNSGDLTYGPGAAFVELITTIGARPVILEPATHDRLVAYVSHLPQLMSTALASTLASVEKADNIAGPSVRDITRLALSPFDVWRDILVTNAGNVAEVLDEMIAKLKYIKETLVQEELRAIFDEAAGAAARVRKMN